MEPGQAVEERFWSSEYSSDMKMHVDVPLQLFEVKVKSSLPRKEPLSVTHLSRRVQVRRRETREEPERSTSEEEFALALIKRIELRICNKKSGRCGFSQHARHEAIALSAEGYVAEKAGRGLYRSVRTCQGISTSTPGMVYFEMHILALPDKGGLCIGLSGTSAPLDKMVGWTDNAIGFYSTGQVISNNRWKPYATGYSVGDSVGCSMSFRSTTCDDDDTNSNQSPLSTVDDGESIPAPSKQLTFRLEFSVNGQPLSEVEHYLVLSAEEEIFPTVSLLGVGTKVVCRCCPTDQKFAPISMSVAGSMSLCGSPLSDVSSPASLKTLQT